MGDHVEMRKAEAEIESASNEITGLKVILQPAWWRWTKVAALVVLGLAIAYFFRNSLFSASTAKVAVVKLEPAPAALTAGDKTAPKGDAPKDEVVAKDDKGKGDGKDATDKPKTDEPKGETATAKDAVKLTPATASDDGKTTTIDLDAPGKPPENIVVDGADTSKDRKVSLVNGKVIVVVAGDPAKNQAAVNGETLRRIALTDEALVKANRNASRWRATAGNVKAMNAESERMMRVLLEVHDPLFERENKLVKDLECPIVVTEKDTSGENTLTLPETGKP
ncbi:MAG: hypothetical protein PHN89_03645 [Candidatus Pacebacteria bacterium]|nr:hypothetical protein [Candidatus Paceibacterota bacterium]